LLFNNYDETEKGTAKSKTLKTPSE
jgi:hypothetical protein